MLIFLAMNLLKTQIPAGNIGVYPILSVISLATTGVCVFCATALAVALFNLRGFRKECKSSRKESNILRFGGIKMKKLKTIIFTGIIMCVGVMSGCGNNDDNISYIDNNSSIQEENNASLKREPKIVMRNDEAFANSDDVFETDEYIYDAYLSDLHRVDKLTQDAIEISDDSVRVAAATKDTIYFYKNATLYKISDSSTTPQMLYSLNTDTSSYVFIQGRNIYIISPNGTVSRSINSAKKYSDSKEVIYQSTGNNELSTARLYKDNIYIKLSDKDDVMGKTNKLIRVSVEDGKSSVIANNIDTFYFCNDMVIFSDFTGKVFHRNKSQNENEEYLELATQYNWKSTMVVGEFVYKWVKGKQITLSIKNNELTENTLNNRLEFGTIKTDSGFAYSDGVKLYLYDKEGNKTGTIITN